MEPEEAMGRALALAERGRGSVEPNPMVGAVLLSADGSVAGEGYHERYGEAHAEINALSDAAARGIDPRGLTMYVTLEPCAHRGKTGPCAEALVEAGVGRVVVAMEDPYPEVAGRGIARLRAAGVAVQLGVGQDAARRLNEAYLKRVTKGLPWVVAKWAQTLDGRTATAAGHSQWISSAASRERVHELRGRVDAVVVGVGTVIADDPWLTARPADPAGIRRVARRVVVDRSERMPASAKMLHDGGPEVTVWSRGVEAGLRELAEAGATNVLVEGGATLVGAMLREGLVDQLWVFVAPKVVGDAAALPAVKGLDCPTMHDALGLTLRGVSRIGGDVLLDYGVAGED